MTGTNRTIGVVAALLVVLLVGGSTVVSAAGTTDISIEPTQTEVVPGQTTTVDVVVADTTGGVGATELRLELADPSVASIANVTIHGDPGFTDINYSAERGWVDIAYAAADTADSGEVPVLTATIEGDTDGTTDIVVEPRADNDAVVSYNESGSGYDIGDISESTVAVEGNDDRSSSGRSGGSAASEPEQTPTATPAPTETQTTETPDLAATPESEPVAADDTTATASDTETTMETPSVTEAPTEGSTVAANSGWPPFGIALIVSLVGFAAVAIFVRQR